MKQKNKKKAVHTVKALTGTQILKTLGISVKQYKKDIKEMLGKPKNVE